MNAEYAAFVRRVAQLKIPRSDRRHRLVYSDQRLLSLQLASLRDSSLLSRLASSGNLRANGDALHNSFFMRFTKHGEVRGSAPGQGVGSGLNGTYLRRV